MQKNREERSGSRRRLRPRRALGGGMVPCALARARAASSTRSRGGVEGSSEVDQLGETLDPIACRLKTEIGVEGFL